MTGPEHYREAERLLAAGTLPEGERGYTAPSVEVLLAGVGHAVSAALTTGALRERVELGMTWLDARHPGWIDLIDLQRLDVASPCRCLLGQVIGEFDLSVAGLDMDMAAELGFDATHTRTRQGLVAEYAALTEVWRAAILQRRAEVARD